MKKKNNNNGLTFLYAVSLWAYAIAEDNSSTPLCESGMRKTWFDAIIFW